MKSYRSLTVLFILFFLLGCAKGGTYLIRIQYQPARDFPSLSAKTGPTIGLVPIKDDRPEQHYLGQHVHSRGSVSYFKSDPYPLDQAMMHSISQTLSRFGIRAVPLSSWDGKPGALHKIETDSVLMVELKRFWIEGRSGGFRATSKTSAQLTIHLGVKKEGKVFTRNIEVEKENTWPRFTLERVETLINQTLADAFDSFFSNPY